MEDGALYLFAKVSNTQRHCLGIKFMFFDICVLVLFYLKNNVCFFLRPYTAIIELFRIQL